MASLLGSSALHLVKHNSLANKRLISSLVLETFLRSVRPSALVKNNVQSENDAFLKNSTSEYINCRGLRCGKNTDETCKKEEKSALSLSAGSKQQCMYDDPTCCNEKCPDANIKQDCIHSSSDKKQYQQTWVDFAPPHKVEKVLCCNQYEKKDPPLPVRSKKSPPPGTACSMDGSDRMLLDCPRKDKKSACIKIGMPGCQPARESPKCNLDRRKIDCKKVQCPFPSFSECNKPKIPKKKPVECQCLEVTTMCDMYAIAKRKGMTLTK